MQYSIYTRGKNTDYKWNVQPDLNFQEYLGGNGCLAVRRIDEKFAVYFVSEPSEMTDSQGRKIRVSVLVSSCTEAKARSLAIWGLEHWGNYTSIFTEFVRNFGQDDWSINTPAAERWVNSINEQENTPELLLPAFSDRYENGNTDNSRKALIDELRQHTFSSKAGFKLAADGGLMTGSTLTKLKESVDRYLAGNETRKELKIAEPVLPDSTRCGSQGSVVNRMTICIAILIISCITGSALFYLNVHRPLQYENLALKDENRKLDRCRKYLKDEELITQLQEEKLKLESMIPELQGKVNGLNSTIAQKNDEVAKLQQKYNTEQNNINTANKEYRETQKEIDVKRKELSELQSDIDKQKQAWLKTFDNWQRQIRGWQQQIQNSPQYQQLQQTMENWFNQIQQWRQEQENEN